MDYFYIWHKWSLSLEGVSRVTFFFSESENFKFWQFFKTFRPWPWKKNYTILDGFFPYIAQMITSMRGCVPYNDLWPWPISSRSLGLDLENRVLSVASTVLDGFFPYLVQMITSMRRCVACDDLWTWPISSRSFDLDFENRVRSVTFSVLDRFFLLGIQYDSIVWAIMRRRGYPQNAGVLVVLANLIDVLKTDFNWNYKALGKTCEECLHCGWSSLNSR